MKKVYESIGQSTIRCYEPEGHDKDINAIQLIDILEQYDISILMINTREDSDVSLSCYGGCETPSSFKDNFEDYLENSYRMTAHMYCYKDKKEFTITSGLNVRRIVLSSEEDLELEDVIPLDAFRKKYDLSKFSLY